MCKSGGRKRVVAATSAKRDRGKAYKRENHTIHGLVAPASIGKHRSITENAVCEELEGKILPEPYVLAAFPSWLFWKYTPFLHKTARSIDLATAFVAFRLCLLYKSRAA